MATPARVVVVANRVPSPPTPDGPSSVGGLVSAVQPALEEHGGIWFGWSGAAGSPDGSHETRTDDGVEYVTLDLTQDEIAQYYEGFANGTLWPLMHGLPQYAHADEREYETWLSVNARFARVLAPLLQAGDLVWVHDYHLIALGAALRGAGWHGRIGYFHHIPVPLSAHWGMIPHVDAIAADFVAYDVIGVQTERDRARLAAHVPPARDRILALPIGIDPERMRTLSERCPDDPFAEIRQGRSVLFGLDRLDYTKGVPLRLEAFERLLQDDQALRDDLVFVQWSAPSRETIPEYQAERRALEAIAARIEAAHLGVDAVQLRVEVIPPEQVAAALRDAEVCLVTSLADGMNLVAKEFVAVQRAEDPGVLVLTEGCGAAEQMVEAVIVPSGDIGALARGLREAAAMPLAERQRRWRALSVGVEQGTASVWSHRFLDALAGANPSTT
jgi:trehalose 6-phosphate synthase